NRACGPEHRHNGKHYFSRAKTVRSSFNTRHLHFIDHRLEPALDQTIARHAHKTAYRGKTCENNQWNGHHARRFVRSMRLVSVGSGNSVSTVPTVASLRLGFRLRLVRAAVVCSSVQETLFPFKSHRHQPRHVESGDPGGQKSDAPENVRRGLAKE